MQDDRQETIKQLESGITGATNLGYRARYEFPTAAPTEAAPAKHANRLQEFFDRKFDGQGIWKWTHYFEIYDRHLSRFRNTDVRILEIGVYSGGSLEMWRDYFGPKVQIFGVDIEESCTVYRKNGVEIHIGDQSNRGFWQEFKKQVGPVDIVIDDGGHQPIQQLVSIEELLPHVRPGGVYLCEDVHGAMHPFVSYVHGLSHQLQEFRSVFKNDDDPERRLGCIPTAFQQQVASIHMYPFVVVLERSTEPVTEFVAPKHGTAWQPYLK